MFKKITNLKHLFSPEISKINNVLKKYVKFYNNLLEIDKLLIDEDSEGNSFEISILRKKEIIIDLKQISILFDNLLKKYELTNTGTSFYYTYSDKIPKYSQYKDSEFLNIETAIDFKKTDKTKFLEEKKSIEDLVILYKKCILKIDEIKRFIHFISSEHKTPGLKIIKLLSIKESDKIYIESLILLFLKGTEKLLSKNNVFINIDDKINISSLNTMVSKHLYIKLLIDNNLIKKENPFKKNIKNIPHFLNEEFDDMGIILIPNTKTYERSKNENP
jgi:hypothetical protein